jgi:hypothetical protein
MFRFGVIVSIGLGIWLGSLAGGERMACAQAPPLGATVAPTVQGPVYYPFHYSDHASTLEEGASRGLADLVRSAGAANLLHSEAAKNYEQARSQYFDNRLKGTQTYFELKQLNQDYRAELRGQRASAEQLFRLAKERAPEPLSPSELDPYSGEIRWPTLLLDPVFADNRVLAENLVRRRVFDAAMLNVDERAALRAALGSLSAQMQERITLYNQEDYAAAKNFLQSLAVTTGAGLL